MMIITIREYIKKKLEQGHVNIFPYSKDIRDMGFYMLIHLSTRIINEKQSYQCTLFLKETPYCHDFRHLWDIINNIESNDYRIEGDILYSMMCDNGVIELANYSKIPNNEKIEDIHKLTNRYNDKLCLIQEEQPHFFIKSLFDEYIETDKYTIEQVEAILNELLR